jgi:uncharacterized OB-fold protein
MMRIIPRGDPLTQPYWEGVRRRELLIQACRTCSAVWHPPLHRCPACHGTDVVWKPVSGHAALYSYTVVHHAPHVAVADRLPYVVALATLDEGPRVVCNLMNCARQDIRIGMRLRLCFEEIAPGILLPQFEPAQDARKAM